MAKNSVEMTIKMIDEASAVLNNVKNNIQGLDSTASNSSQAKGGLGQFAEKFFYIGNLVGTVAGTIKSVGQTVHNFTVGAAADMEQTSVAFETLIGNTELARDTIKQIQDLGAQTPFQFPELADAGRKLIAFGTSAETVRDELAMVGDIASGIQAPIGEIAEIYGKARVQGRLFAEDINQLTGRGIPVITEFAALFGTTEANIKSMVTNGELGFTDLQLVFERMTSEGGKFNNMMEAQSQTFNGLVSTVQDNVNVVLTNLGAKIIETFDLKGALEGGIKFINDNMPLIEGVIDTAFNFITTAIGMGKTAVSQLSDEFNVFWTSLQTIWNVGLKPLLEALGPLFKATFETAGIAIKLLMDVVTGVVSGIAALLEGDFKGFVTAFVQLGKDMVQGLINGIGSMLTGLKDSVVNLGGNIISWFKNAVGSQSPWQTTIKEGQNMIEGLLIGITDPTLRAELQAEIDKLAGQMINFNIANMGLGPTTRVPGAPSIVPPSGGSSPDVYSPGITFQFLIGKLKTCLG